MKCQTQEPALALRAVATCTRVCAAGRAEMAASVQVRATFTRRSSQCAFLFPGQRQACRWRCFRMEDLVASIVTAAVTVVVEFVVRELLEALRPRRAAALRTI